MIKVNDAEMEWKEGMTVKSLLETMEYTEYHFPVLVVSLNGNHVSQDAFDETPIADGDEIKVFLPLAGG